jgi:hypothetical protein
MQRNPYLILGLPFGASRDEANVAFARQARSLRRQGDAGKKQLVELTWALNQIVEALRDPDSTLEIYRIPADPDAFDPEGSGFFTPPPERMERRTEPSGPDAAALIGHTVDELALWMAEEIEQRSEIPHP